MLLDSLAVGVVLLFATRRGELARGIHASAIATGLLALRTSRRARTAALVLIPA